MSGFEPVVAEAAAAELGTTALASEVMASNALAAANMAAYTPAAAGALSAVPAGLGALASAVPGMYGVGTATTGALSGGVPTLVEQLTTANPEVLGQLQTALKPAMFDAPAISPEITNLQQYLANSPMPKVTDLAQVAGEVTPGMLNQTPVADVASANLTQSPFLQQAQTAMQAAQNNPELAQAAIDQGLSVPTELSSDLTQEALQKAASQFPPAQYPQVPGSPSDGSGNIFKEAYEGFKAMPTKDKLLYGGVASLATPIITNMFKGKKEPAGATPYDGPLSKFRYDPAQYTSQNINPPTPYKPRYAQGGIADLGGYSDYARGGRMLKGPGDGMSDNIPATIAGKQPARLANEEFVIPADVVSHLGNGSSEAGAKQLYKMMDRVRQARTGKKTQGKQIKADKYLA